MEDFKPSNFKDDKENGEEATVKENTIIDESSGQEENHQFQNTYENKYEEEVKETHSPSVRYMAASGGSRIVAHILDEVFTLIVCIPLFLWAGKKADSITAKNVMDIYFSIIGYIGGVQFIMQFLIPLFTKGKTLGKACLRLRMISEDGGYAGAGQLFGRSTVYTVIPFLEDLPGIGSLISFGMFIFWIVSLVFIFKDDLHQSLQDKMSGIVVIEDYEKYQNRKDKAYL